MFMFWRRLESPLDCNEVKPVNPKRNHPWLFIGRTNVEAEAPILWPPDTKGRLIGKQHPDAGKVWSKRRRGQQRMKWLDRWMVMVRMTDSDMNLSKLQEMVEGRGDWYATAHGITKSQTQLCDWTITTCWGLYTHPHFSQNDSKKS